MTWTALRVVEKGVILRDFHAARFAGSSAAVRAAFDRFCAEAAPGNYSLEDAGAGLRVTPRGASRLTDGMPVRYAVSPIAHLSGRIAKPPPSGPYASVRVDGVATLLTTENGSELLESCVASIIGWDGARLLVPPDDRPRVASTAEAALRAGGAVMESPLGRLDAHPIALVNALKGLGRVAIADRPDFPDEAARIVAAVFDRFTSR